jgi:hypothetical protein
VLKEKPVRDAQAFPFAVLLALVSDQLKTGQA